MSGNKENSVALTEVISTAIQIPGVKVDRDTFLLTQFKDMTPEERERILAEGPVAAGRTRRELQKMAHRLITERTLASSAASFAAGIPGGLAMAAAIPADMLQFYGIALRMAQELAYLYGEENLWCDSTPDAEKVMNQLILYCGVMLGASGASQTVRVMSSALAKQALKKLPQQALTKTFYYPIVKSIAKAFGAKMTKEIFAKGVSKAVPFIGGFISGGITLATMRPMGIRLADTLDEAHFSYTASDFQEDWNDIVDMQQETEAEFPEPIEPIEPAAPTAAERLREAKELFDAGVLTADEFSAMKMKIIEDM